MTPKERAAIQQALKDMKRAWLWMENQAEGQSKGGHATFDLMMLREERDALQEAITTMREALDHSAASGNMVPDHIAASGKVILTAEQAQQIEEALMVATTPLAVDRQTVLKALSTIRAARAQEPLEDCYKVTYRDGTSCHFGNKRLAEINARQGDKIEVVKLRNLSLVESPIEPVKYEPVAFTNKDQLGYLKDPRYQTTPMAMWATPFNGSVNVALYTAPVRTKDLTDDQIYALYNKAEIEPISFARAVLKFAKELNHG